MMDKKLPGSLPEGLSQPARRALAAAGIENLAQLAQFSEKEIHKLHGIGPNALKKLSVALAQIGMQFKQEKDNS